jgi:hypothetical protein
LRLDAGFTRKGGDLGVAAAVPLGFFALGLAGGDLGVAAALPLGFFALGLATPFGPSLFFLPPRRLGGMVLMIVTHPTTQ